MADLDDIMQPPGPRPGGGLRTVVNCPSCQSEKTRRGGMATWFIYLVLIALSLVAVLLFEYNAALVAAIMIAIIVLVHLLLNQRVCLTCGHQWRG